MFRNYLKVKLYVRDKLIREIRSGKKYDIDEYMYKSKDTKFNGYVPLSPDINPELGEDFSKTDVDENTKHVLKTVFRANKEISELVKMNIYEQMKFYNKTKQYDKTILLWELLSYEKNNTFLLKEYKTAYEKNLEQINFLKNMIDSIYKEKKPKVEYKYIFYIFLVLFFTLNFEFCRRELLKDKKIKRFNKISEPEIKTKLFSRGIESLIDSFEVKYANNINERLDNLKGLDEVKEEIQELISILKNPEEYIKAGAKLPKGILLCGRPGTGKTLIARAIAGEAGVNFIYLTGSDFDEMYVGVGASRIRKLFKTAKDNKPCIIFIDEIDSLLSSSRRKGEHSSSRATINQFLTEMDGFDKLDNILLIGATNHENDLDNAAVRPGRFDKKIHINVPDETGRIDIIKFYLSKIKLKKKDLDPIYIAKLTPGFTGAEIENLINLSIVRAVTLSKEEVDMEDIGESRDRVIMGIANKNYSMSDKKRYAVALHEGGHTLVCYKSVSCRKTLDKVTVIPRGSAMGVTMRLSDEEALNSKTEFIEFIDMCMGGHVAEELIYGKEHVTAGCSSDLDKATSVALNMVKKYGMYGNLGYIFVEDEGYIWEEDSMSDKYKHKIDEVVGNILKDSHDRVYKLLKNNSEELKSIARNLFIYDTLYFEDIVASIEGRDDDIKRDKVRNSFKDIINK